MNNADDPSHADRTPAPASAALRAPVLPVSLLVANARLLIERQFGLVWVAGEISNFTRAASGHCYFNLKDANAQVRCVLFRLKAQALAIPLRDGQQVEVRATPTLYEARGEFQLNIDHVRLAGLGALYEQFARLKGRLDAAGWFAAERKRPLPTFPRAVGIVTSPRAAALRDILTTLVRRAPRVRVILYPASVQGTGAAAELAAAIQRANARAEVDVLIVARGGGSIEDLWAFNEEVVARAVFESALPVVSGVGHETDFTICDFVADLRAPTPTAAAAAVTPDRAALARRVGEAARRLARAATHALAARTQALDRASRRLVHPATRIAQQRARTSELSGRLMRAWRAGHVTRAALVATLEARVLRELRRPPPVAARLHRSCEGWLRAGRERVARAEERLAALGRGLAHLNPRAVLERGYAIVATADGTIVQEARQVAAGDPVALTFARGEADAAITSVRK